MSTSLCNLPTLSVPNPDDILAAIAAVLEALGSPFWPLPPLPTITPPNFLYCPLD